MRLVNPFKALFLKFSLLRKHPKTPLKLDMHTKKA